MANKVTKTRLAGPGVAGQLLIFVLTIAAGGCVSLADLPDDYAEPTPLPREIADRFCYLATPVREQVTLRDEKKSYRIYAVSIEAGLPQFEDDSPVTLEYYEQIDDSAAPVVLVLPILNGQKNVVRPFARYFARNGYAVALVDSVQRKTLLQDLVNPEQAIIQSILRHRRVLDWIEIRPEIDATRIAVFGASLGGFNALFLAASDARVRAAAPALVAGDLPFVLTHSDERRIVEAVAGAGQDLSLDQDGLQQYLEDNIKTDPVKLAPHIDASKVLLILAKFDKAVPFEKQLELREAMGNPESITIPTGHTTAAAYLFYLRRKVREFFDRKLSASGEPGGTASLPAANCAASDDQVS
jgi:dienelactone hydrolase